MPDPLWPWLALAGLGAFHGVNPAMGWLFAVGLGLQRRSRAAVLWALLPVALGHAGSIAAVLALAALLGGLLDAPRLQLVAAAALFAFGLYRLRRGYRHRLRGGMQAGFADLALWSLVMAVAHGAPLMILPAWLALPGEAHAGHVHGPGAAGPLAAGVLAVLVHTAAMLAVTAAVAVAVYEWVGLAFLRRGWINLDLLWSLALMAAGAALGVLAAGIL